MEHLQISDRNGFALTMKRQLKQKKSLHQPAMESMALSGVG